MATLSQAVFHSFKGFVIFEAVFALLMLWIFTFFAWGFVYHGTLQSRKAAFFLASGVFFILLLNHFHTPILLIPLLCLLQYIGGCADAYTPCMSHGRFLW